MITENYCSYEVSKLLKEKGFKIPKVCHSLIDKWEDVKVTHQRAMKWLREEKHIILVFKPAMFSGEECTYWTYEIWAGDNFEGEVTSFKTYEEAVEAALKYTLNNLI